MLDISWADFLVLIVAGLFILGPERLPGAARWLGKTVRQVREYATGARDQLQSELGPEFEEFRKPLQDLSKLRNFDPKKVVTQHLLDATGGYDPREDLRINGTNGSGNGSNGSNGVKPNGFSGVGNQPAAPQQRPLSPGERPPFDPDAT
ncbi:MAG TPA: Sec-independent protein translocase protein TatB [Pseudonocardiaceae bacterium]|jgi:sec-independent protein translocase protein TatB|nr:Sec-independent protein translocase protein TatB [Pseudonocardiaceae bacterium]